MKCGACYADNPAYLKRCRFCGEPTRAVEFCPNGHIVDPITGECAACRVMWPEVSKFEGAPVLRGALWAERGNLVDAASGTVIPVLALADGEAPVSIEAAEGSPVTITAGNAPDAAAKLLTRPEGIGLCVAARFKPGAARTYERIEDGARIEVGGVALRVVLFRAPSWAGSS
jgi:hypothetical protein